jgi:uncharacterized protein (TIGR02266 family)
MQSEERRQHHRHKTWRVEVKVATPEAFRSSYLRDVSAGGLFVRSRTPLPIGSRVAVVLDVDGRELRLSGTVVRHEPAGFGVRFDALDDEKRLQLEALAASSRTSAISAVADLAEARGIIEAYEENLAALREAETAAVQRAELAAFECTVLQEHLQRVQRALDEALAENARLARALAQGASSGAAAPASEVERLREDVRSLAAELDDERLKAMALQRALERFQAMGGVIPRAAPASRG